MPKEKLNKLQQRQIKVLNDTVKHYTTHLRCKQNQKCSYINSEGERCAIGRLISKKLCSLFEKERINGISDCFDRVPKRVQSLKLDFLMAIQSLHDISDYWEDSKGRSNLSDLGKQHYEGILESIKKGVYK